MYITHKIYFSIYIISYICYKKGVTSVTGVTIFRMEAIVLPHHSLFPSGYEKFLQRCIYKPYTLLTYCYGRS